MFLSQKSDGSLIEILDLKTLFNPAEAEVLGRCHSGEEMQDEEKYAKLKLNFPSGESLPRCWVDADYRDPS